MDSPSLFELSLPNKHPIHELIISYRTITKGKKEKPEQEGKTKREIQPLRKKGVQKEYTLMNLYSNHDTATNQYSL